MSDNYQYFAQLFFYCTLWHHLINEKNSCQKQKGAEAIKIFTMSLPTITYAFSKRQSNSLNHNEQLQSSENVMSVADDQGQNQNVCSKV